MKDNRSGATRVRFAGFVLDLARRELLVDGKSETLQPLLFDALVYFVENPGRVISKNELTAAVWRSPVVTDSAVARVVMKLRRTVGPLLTTVHGIGYRFDASVEEESPQLATSGDERPRDDPVALRGQGPLAVLRVEDRRDRLPGGQDEAALTSWLHFALLNSGFGNLVPLASILAWKPGAASDDTIARACGVFGARWALTCKVKLSGGAVGGAVSIEAAWGTAQGLPAQQIFTGASFGHALRGLVAALGGTPAVPLAGPSWTDDLFDVVLLESKGRVVEALERMPSVANGEPGAAGRGLLKARLQLQLNRLDEAASTLGEALATPALADQPGLRLELQAKLAAVRIRQSDYPGATECLRAALAIATFSGYDATLANLLQSVARLEVSQGNYRTAVATSARAVERADRSGDTATQVKTKTLHAAILGLAGETQEAFLVAHQAATAAALLDMPVIQGDTYFATGMLHVNQRQPTTGLRYLQQAKGFITPRSDVHAYRQLLTFETDALLALGQVDEAESVLQALERVDEKGNAGDTYASIRRAMVTWSRGAYEPAVRQLEQCFEAESERRSHTRWTVAQSLAGMYLSTGQAGKLGELIRRAADNPYPMALRHWEAGLALLLGDRGRYKEMLTAVWLQHPPNEPANIDSALNLAWALLEESDVKIEPESAFWSQIAAFSDEYACAKLVHLRMRLRGAHGEFPAGDWVSVVRSCPGLVNRHAWLLDPAAITSLPMRRLNEPFCMACR